MDNINTIGFIGAGIMGQGMVQNLLKAGHKVNIIANRNRRPIEELVANIHTELGNCSHRDLTRDTRHITVLSCRTI